MKPFALLVLLVLAIAAAVAPGVYGLQVDAQGTRLRHLQDDQQPDDQGQPNDEQPDDQQLPGNAAGDDNGAGDNEKEILVGGCFPGSWGWPRCRYGGGGGCFPGSWNWPRCRYGGGGGCFPGSWGWPRCRGF